MSISVGLGLIGLVTLFAVAGLQAEPAWGKPNQEGLMTRLVPLEEKAQVGRPLSFRLEAKNTGKETVYADLQSLAHPDSLLAVTYQEEGSVPVISADLAGCQTAQSYMAFPPGEVVVVAGRIDAAEEFEIAKGGSYRFRHPGLNMQLPVFKENEGTNDINGKRLDSKTRFTNLAASQEVRLEVQDGVLTTDLNLFKRLRPIVPKDWFLCRRWKGSGVVIGRHDGTGAVIVELLAIDPKAKVAMEEGQRKLGGGPLGEIRMGVTIDGGKRGVDLPQRTNLRDFWPGAEAAIRKALGVEPSDA